MAVCYSNELHPGRLKSSSGAGCASQRAIALGRAGQLGMRVNAELSGGEIDRGLIDAW
jgi:hypothetical protein